MKNWIAGAVVAAGLIGAMPAEAEHTVTSSEQAKAEFSAWAQAWYQRVGEAQQDTRLNDFMLRRVYFSLKGERGPRLGFFVHLAADRICAMKQSRWMKSRARVFTAGASTTSSRGTTPRSARTSPW